MFDIDSFIHISWTVLGTLRTIDITGGLSHACYQFTSLIGNQVVSTMFDIDSFIHMARIVPIREVEMKTLDLVSTIQAARSFVFIIL